MNQKITISIPLIQFLIISAITACGIMTMIVILSIQSENKLENYTFKQALIEKCFKDMAALAKKKAIGYPVQADMINSSYGFRRNPIRRFIGGTLRGYHEGVDLPATNGQPVKAAADGIVIARGRTMIGGKYVILDHEDGLTTVYFHLDHISVKSGELVTRNDIIGTAGKTGITTGPHLHFAIRYNGVAVNPAFWLNRAD